MSDISEDEYDDLDIIFHKAARHLQHIHTDLHQKDLLEFYSLYKQGLNGHCNVPKPGIFNAQGRAKWNAWNSLGDMEQSKAKELYIKKITELYPNWDSENRNKQKTQWVCQSMPQRDPDHEIADSDKTPFDHVKENNLSQLKKHFPSDLNQLDDTGLGFIHWAADRNATEILEFLLSKGANANLQDVDGQTALHYASSCGHFDCVKSLIKFGADRTILDNDGTSCLDIAFDSSILELLKS